MRQRFQPKYIQHYKKRVQLKCVIWYSFMKNGIAGAPLRGLFQNFVPRCNAILRFCTRGNVYGKNLRAHSRDNILLQFFVPTHREVCQRKNCLERTGESRSVGNAFYNPHFPQFIKCRFLEVLIRSSNKYQREYFSPTIVSKVIWTFSFWGSV